MSLPATTSFDLYKGDTLRFRMYLKSSGSAYAIAGTASFSGGVKENKTSASVVHPMTATVESASAGQVLITLSASTSALLSATKNWIYDIQMNEDGIIKTLLSGNIFVTDQVTTG